MLDNFRKQLKKRGNKNFNFVTARKVHHCSHCLKVIRLHEECLTFNPYMGTRRWYCENCVQLMLNVKQAQVMRSLVAFDDEGAELAFMEWEDEALADLEEARG